MCLIVFVYIVFLLFVLFALFYVACLFFHLFLHIQKQSSPNIKKLNNHQHNIAISMAINCQTTCSICLVLVFEFLDVGRASCARPWGLIATMQTTTTPPKWKTSKRSRSWEHLVSTTTTITHKIKANTRKHKKHQN